MRELLRRRMIALRGISWRIQIEFGAVICPECGSRDIVVHGCEPCRWECRQCGAVTGVWCS
jgi:transposase-like protein